MNPKSYHFIEWCLAALLTMMILINIGWGIFRYGGTYYYMKITRPTGTYPITLPVNVSATGYQYQGLATNSKGEKERFVSRRSLQTQHRLNAGKSSESPTIKDMASPTIN
ncbi:YxeA family protein [Lactiplantibacillus pentosus]|nr:YxeA family protein [Lactiplantibacillus pentosus]